MRNGIVLAGVLTAAVAAILVWLDATGQLRPLLTTTPEVVIELTPASLPADLSPAPATAAATNAPPEPGETESGADDAATEPTAAGTQHDTSTDSAATQTAPAVFGSGAVALSDVPIATEEDAAGPSDANGTGDGNPEAAAEPQPETAAPATDDAPADGAAPAEEPAAQASTDVGVAEEDATATGTATAGAGDAAVPAEPLPDPAGVTADAAAAAGDATAASAGAVPEPKPDAPAIDPAALQTAALPILPRDPNLPWRLYAAPFPEGEPRPRIAIVFVSLGLSDAATEAIIQQLPGAVSLAFSPYSRKLQDWILRARAKGHEVLVELPMEPLNYPEDDPGPLALLDDRPIEDNITRLDGILARAEGAVGVAALMGSRFSGNEELMRPILTELAERGYVYLDNSTAPASVVPSLARRIAVPVAINDHYLDSEASRIAIDGRLQQIERIARSEGVAVAFASPYPITIERLLAWIPTLEAKGFVLAPVTAVVGRQDAP